MRNAATATERLDPAKFSDPQTTASGEPRARVRLRRLATLWINTGTLCNLACQNCYIESSPRNDRLVYITATEAATYLDEIERDGWDTQTIAFTGGEPFMNPDMLAMTETALARGFAVLVLTNAMKPMMKRADGLLALQRRYRSQLTLRVSIDHYTKTLHEAERGRRTWQPTVNGLRWLAAHDFSFTVAGRMFSGETESVVRRGFAELFQRESVTLDAYDPGRLTLFPEMDASADVPEISEGCWQRLGQSPEDVMCTSSRMIVKRKGAACPAVVSCTLLPYDPKFELGVTLAEANTSVALNHPHCARFCVLGGASCS